MILLIDNYDSFSYNLFQMVGELFPDILVIRNDAKTVAEIKELDPSHIILSPGPGRPEDAGVTIDVVKELGGQIPILGVCLGHQAICAAYGATITYAQRLMHGKQSVASFDHNCVLFKDMPTEALVARYHSLAVDPETLPPELKVVSRTVDTAEVMAVQHTQYHVYGLQFHPESIMTPDGRRILQNFIDVGRTCQL
ncbi:MAG: aminodeoxychorismate/anthranilate synthase component II [Planctomycetia bacterium]|nr:aminodeoxychorismate/anthranilate synthase component II [Planctomycetia bacterium]